MPVRIWMSSRVSEALPKTYHQPLGLSRLRGTGCSSIGLRLSPNLRRLSNQARIRPMTDVSRCGLVVTLVPASSECRAKSADAELQSPIGPGPRARRSDKAHAAADRTPAHRP